MVGIEGLLRAWLAGGDLYSTSASAPREHNSSTEGLSGRSPVCRAPPERGKLQRSIAIYRGKAASLLSSALALRVQAGTAG